MKWYYLLASLPPLSPVFGTEPPITLAAFWKKIQEEASPLQELLQAALLIRDIDNLEQVYHRQQPALEGTVPLDLLRRIIQDPLSRSWYLPEPLVLADAWKVELWEQYFDYALGIGKKHSSKLEELLYWELALRHAFFKLRCENLGKGKKSGISVPIEYFAGMQKVTDSYAKASNPQEAEQLLDKARWDKIASLAIPYCFEQDEVVVYALQLLILERWWNISQNEEDIFEKVANANG